MWHLHLGIRAMVLAGVLWADRMIPIAFQHTHGFGIFGTGFHLCEILSRGFSIGQIILSTTVTLL
jgi:hypothetical protein